MRKHMVAMTVALALLWVGAGSAQAISIHTFEWTGYGGYSVVGSVHDASSTSSYAQGLGAGPTLGLESLAVMFLDPDENVLRIDQNVHDGVSDYDQLSFIFDNEMERILGQIQIGSQTEPDGLFLTGNVSGLVALRTASGALMDYGYGFDVYAGEPMGPELPHMPEPSTATLVSLGLGLLGWSGRRR